VAARPRAGAPRGPGAATRRALFVCPDLAHPVGGVRVIYRHVDILRAAGIDAVVAHEKPGFRCTWFENETPVVDRGSLRLDGRRDLIVVPEIQLEQISAGTRGIPKVVLNQNAYYSFNETPAGTAPARTAYHGADLRAAVVVSADSEAYLRYAFPRLRIERVINGVDVGSFYPDPDKRWQLAYMPRKNAGDAHQVLNLLGVRGALDGIAVDPLDGLPQSEVARQLRSTLLFLSFGHPEGFGLPAAGAMASGCLTIGYHGMGGAEFLRRPYAHPVPVGDVVGFATAVEAILQELRREPGRLLAEAQAAAEFIAREYSREREVASVVDCWRRLLEMP